MSSGCAHPVDHCMCAHRVDHWMCAPSGPLDVCICITTTCKHPRAHRKRYIRWSTRCSYIWWTTSSPLVVIRMQRHLVDHRMWRSPVYYDEAITWTWPSMIRSINQPGIPAILAIAIYTMGWIVTLLHKHSWIHHLMKESWQVVIIPDLSLNFCF